MVENISFLKLQSPLSIGNAVTVGFHLYRSHLRLYSKLALIAHVWLLLPIYGWAKFFTLSAVISRLAFNDLLGQPESVSSALRQLEHRIWNFLILWIFGLSIPFLVALILSVFLTIILSYILSVLSYIPYLLAKDSIQLITNTLAFVVVIAYIIIYFWITSRLFVTDSKLAIENNNGLLILIKNSLKSTKSIVNKIQGIMIISFLITLPVLISIWWGIAFIVRFVSRNFLAHYIVNVNVRATLALIFLSLLTGVIIMPFWQTIKAVVYYDIRCRQEGLDLKLRTLPKNRVREDA